MNDFLERVYALDHAHGKAIDLILDVFNSMMWADQFDEIDQILAAADVDRLNTFSASGLLAAAYCVNSRLKNYLPLLERCREKWPSRDRLWDYKMKPQDCTANQKVEA